MGKTRAGAAAPGITLDAGALIALDRGNKRMIALLVTSDAEDVRRLDPKAAIIQI